MTKQECVKAARACNHEAIRFRLMGNPSVANYFARQRRVFMQWLRTAR